MSKISLRAYTREIDSMIDQGQIDQAVSHCRYILSKFPKHIDTYRLLGKAYLEDNQNSNAADIFQRVLSAVPDDFVSHIGMSLIREEEGNLQSAITHMERAFEKQPYNNAIQEEIRRLYGKRDGLEPSKVRLTQGALARMYLKGGLVSQGIAELRSALAEQSERYDLRTLLAEAYQEAEQVGKAIDTASVILKRFPFNLTANRILAQTLKSHDHPEEMAICRKRLYALSPYEAYVSEHAPTVEEVPDQAITLERMDSARVREQFRTPSETDISWEAALGGEVDEEVTEEEDVPDWLAGESEAETEAPEAALEDAEPAPAVEQEIAEEGVEEVEAAAPVDDLDQQEAQPVEEKFEEEDDMPDWLTEMSHEEGEPAPAEEQEFTEERAAAEDGSMHAEDFDQKQPQSAAEEPEDSDIPDWLAGAPQEEPAQEPEPVQEEGAEEPAPSLDEFRDEDISLDQQVDADEADEDDADPDSPPLPSRQKTPPQEEHPQDELQPSEPDEGIPSWMEEAGWETSKQPPGEPEDIYGTEEAEDDEDLEPAEIPDWLQDKTPPDFDEEPQDISTEKAGQPEAQTEETQPQDRTPQEDPQRQEQPPGRPTVREEQASEDEREITDISPQDLDHELEGETEDFPDWLKDIKADEEEQDTTVAWLNNFTQEQGPEAEDIASVEGVDYGEPGHPQQAPEDLQEPDWIKAQREETPPESSRVTPEESEEFPEAVSEEDASPAGEEVEKDFETDPISEFEQGEGLTSDDVVQEDDFPDWLQELEAEDEPLDHDLPPREDKEISPPQTSEPAPDVLDEDKAEAQPPELSTREEGEPVQEQADDLPDWLGELEAEPEPDREPAGQEDTVSPDAPSADVTDEQTMEEEIDWLEEVDQEEKVEPGPEAADEEAAPVTSGLEDEEVPAPDIEDDDATLAWLESLAEKQGADEEDFVTSAEERARAEAPESMKEDAGTAPEEEVDEELQPEEEELSRAEMPDWLADLEPEDEGPGPEEAGSEISPPEASDLEDLDLEDEDDLPGWLDEMGQETEEVFSDVDEDEIEPPQEDMPTSGQKAAPDVGEETESAPEEAVPGWLGELEDEESLKETDKPPSPDAEKEISPPEEEEKLTFPDTEAEDEGDDMAWLESLTADTQTREEEEQPLSEDPSRPDIPTPDEDKEIPTDTAADHPATPASQEEELPGWLSELDREDADQEEPDAEISGEIEQETISEEPDTSDWLEDIDQSEEEAEELIAEEAPDTSQDSEGPSAVGAKPPSEGMLKHLGELDQEKKQDETQDEIPEWLADFKEEEDPQETAVLWLRRYVEGGEDVDLEKELKAYTDSLGTDDIPEWVEDLQEEDDPTSTAMLWLERLEQEEQFRQGEEQKHQDKDESDWLAELEKEDQQEETPAAAQKETDEFDVDEKGWLSDLEDESAPEGEEPTSDAETESRQEIEQEEEEEVPPWMLATSPLEGDLLTGELMDETEQEEIPDWLAGYQEEEVPAEADEEPAAAEEDDEEYAWLSAYEEEHPEKRKIDLNQAPISQIETLIGVNYQLAEGIVTYREEHGPFESHEELKNVPELDDERILDILRAETIIRPPEKTPAAGQPAERETSPEKPTQEPPQPEKPDLDELQTARNKLDAGDIDAALEIYEEMIDDKENIEQVIEDLTDASYDHPMNVSIIKTLGDAYMSIDKLQEALDAYSKAEDLLR